jgi:hypothetical protein
LAKNGSVVAMYAFASPDGVGLVNVAPLADSSERRKPTYSRLVVW